MMRFFKKFLGKTPSAVLTLLTFLIIFLIIIWAFVPPIINQARKLADIDYNKLVSTLEEPLNDWNGWLVNAGLMEGETEIDTTSISNAQDINQNNIKTRIIPIDSLISQNGDTTQSNITLVIEIDNSFDDHSDQADNTNIIREDNFVDRAKKNIASFLDPSQISKVFGSIVGYLGNFFIGFMSIFFIAFFFLKEQGLFGRMVSSLVPDEHEAKAMTALDESSKMLIRYFLGVATQIIVITVFVSVVLGIMSVKNAMLIGFFAALMNVIPYVGPILGSAFAVVITISSNPGLPFYDQMLPLLLKVLLVFMVMQLLDNFILQPLIFGKSVKAHPLEIFLVVLIGAKLGGVLGMVLAIPMYTVLRVLAKVFLSEFKVVQRITSSL